MTDHRQNEHDAFFRRGDVRFAITTELVDGDFCCVIQVENCNASACCVHVDLVVVGTALRHSQSIDCGGGGSIVSREVWEFPRTFCGRTEDFAVTADITYRDGQGKALRPCVGKPVPARRSRLAETFGNTASAALAGAMILQHDVLLEITLPSSSQLAESSEREERMPAILQIALVGLFITIAVFAAYWLLWR